MTVDDLLRNPISIWVRRLIKKIYYENKYSSKNLTIGYMTTFVGCEFGSHNVLHENVTLSHCQFGDYNSVYSGSQLANVVIGNFSYVAPESKLVNVSIGKFSCIGTGVMAGLGKHPSKDFVTIHPAFYSTQGQVEMSFVSQSCFVEHEPIKIGNDVWIGARAIIMDGVTIGNGAIVAAGAVVTKNVSDYAIVGGIPARVLRYRFEHQDIECLMRMKWWDRDINWLKENAEKFQHMDKFRDLCSDKEAENG